MKAKTQFKAGRFDQAIQETIDLRNSDNRDAAFWYFLAGFYSEACSMVPNQQAELQQHALSSLRKSIRYGYRDAQRLERDAEFNSLHSHEEFRQLVTELKNKNSSSTK
jgi:predicted Zn-dependent protease